MEIVSLNYFKKLGWKSERLKTLLIKNDPGIWGKKDGEKGIPVLRSTNFNDDGTLDFTNPALIKLDNKKRTEKKLNFGDILLERSGGGPNKPVGRVVYFTKKDEEYSYGNFIQRFRVNRDRLDSKFLFYVLYYLHYLGITQKIQNQTTGIRNLDYNSYLNIWVPVPPLAEQRGVVEVLGTVDECIRLTDAVIERDEELKRGFMQQLLTRGIGHTEYKETPLGEIPKTWMISKLIEVIKNTPQNGLYKHSSQYGAGTFILRINDFNNGEFLKINDFKRVKIEPDELELYKLKNKDIVINRVNSIPYIGKCTIVPKISEPIIFESNMIRITIDSNIMLPEFVNKWICASHSKRHFLKRAKRAVAQASINQKDVNSLLVPIPPIDEQRDIIGFFNSVENIIQIERARHDKLNKMKQGLMQVILSGKIRVELKEDGIHRIGDGREANN